MDKGMQHHNCRQPKCNWLSSKLWMIASDSTRMPGKPDLAATCWKLDHDAHTGPVFGTGLTHVMSIRPLAAAPLARNRQ